MLYSNEEASMFEKNLGMLPLFDLYGAMLPEQKQKMFELYYGDDLSLSEIAEEMNISRQGVRDSIKKCEEQLREFEEKLGFYEKTRSVERAVRELETLDIDEDARRKILKISEDLKKISE